MKTALLTTVRLATPIVALAAGLVIGTIAGSVSAQPLITVDPRDDARAALGASATPFGLEVARAPHAHRSYRHQADAVAAYDLSADRPTVVARARPGRGYVRRAGEVTAFGLAGDAPSEHAAGLRPGYQPWTRDVR